MQLCTVILYSVAVLCIKFWTNSGRIRVSSVVRKFRPFQGHFTATLFRYRATARIATKLGFGILTKGIKGFQTVLVLALFS